MEPVQNEVVQNPAVAPAGASEVLVEVVASPGDQALAPSGVCEGGSSCARREAASSSAALERYRESTSSTREVLTHDGERVYPSLYDGTWTTFSAIVFGVIIVGSVQALVVKMYSSAKSEHDYLTRFVTSLVALIVGCYIADLLIAGPSTQLLSDTEKATILAFVKDTALMIFSYYFGLKAQTPPPNADSRDTE